MSGNSFRQAFVLSVLSGLLYLALADAFYTGVASRVLGANDFYSRWMGSRALFLDGQDPYSEEVTRQIQLGMYGRLARPDEDQVAFAYPLYAAFFALPLVALPYAWAESLWMALLTVLLIGAGTAWMRTLGWRPSPLGLLGLLGFILAFYPALRGVFLGQYALIVFASFAFGLTLIAEGHDGWAGAVLAVSLVKPHVAVLALAVILSWGPVHRRWRLLSGFSGTLGALLLASALILPNWPLEFVGAVEQYQNYIHLGPPVQVLSGLLFPSAAAEATAGLFTLLLFAALLYKWVRTLGGSWEDYTPSVEFAMIVTTLAMGAAPCLTPYVELPSWARALPAVPGAELEMCAEVIGPWILVFSKAG